MITDNDIKKLKNEFKKDFATKDDLKNYATKIDLQNMTDEIIKATTELVGGVIERVDKISEKLDANLDEVNDHERRIRKLEDKVLSTTNF